MLYAGRYHISSVCFCVYVWTGENDSNTLRVDANFFKNGGKNLRFRKYPHTCGQGLCLLMALEAVCMSRANRLTGWIDSQLINEPTTQKMNRIYATSHVFKPQYKSTISTGQSSRERVYRMGN